MAGKFGVEDKQVVHRSLKLRGELPPSKREEMKKQDRAALGGMRNPASSLARVPGSCVAGDKIRSVLDDIIASHESLREPVRRILAGLPSSGFSADAVKQAREKVWHALGISQPPLATGLQPDLIEKYVALAADPDIDLAPWLREGAPLGALKPVTPRGVCPVDQRGTTNRWTSVTWPRAAALWKGPPYELVGRTRENTTDKYSAQQRMLFAIAGRCNGPTLLVRAGSRRRATGQWHLASVKPPAQPCFM